MIDVKTAGDRVDSLVNPNASGEKIKKNIQGIAYKRAAYHIEEKGKE